MNLEAKSWSEAFRRHVIQARNAKARACVRCGKGPVSSMWYGELTHIGCLSPDEIELAKSVRRPLTLPKK